MSLIFEGFGKVVGNTVVLPSIQLNIEKKDVIAIQADMEYMHAFLSLMEEDRSYMTNEIRLSDGVLCGVEDLFFYRTNMGEYKRLTPEQTVRFWCDLYGVKVDIDRILALVELNEVRRKKNKGLTFSEKKRLQFARSLIQPTNIYIFQEPTYHIDLQSKQVLNRILNELLKKDGFIIILTSSLEESIRIGTKVFRLTDRGLQQLEYNEDAEEEVEEKEASDIEDETIYQQRFEKISAKSDDKFILFDPLEIDFVESRDRQTILHVNNEEFISTVSMKDIETRLHIYGFFRCHRSYLVNLQRVREVVVWSKNSYSLTLENEKTVPLSKSRYGELKELLNW
ncbi:LytTR family transcriptional regulator DNA-binding domain-containing protein [Cytobacillus sp. Sa5YUA1]|uniref:LytTR family transcriptional regulator DNA-binding domain-containing protein n=1 Tax=Cytobacillus stercorigallinarum TaxID=2762240 RepID=A0ABR8QP77_9BACI|nr:LytTR family transcriptional regulator DNA-binding domain-containing protein [Cytobacillus stercorigallinarum]MBD7937325.1 LytTR family transcriptional regulator DNA-binding domain-containing protein [Cytobacillus stercorigallinarum]